MISNSLSNRTRSALYRSVALGIMLSAACHAAAQQETNAVAPDYSAVLKRTEAALAAVGATPGREYANRLRNDPYSSWFAFFRGEGPRPGSPSESAILADINNFLGLIEAGPGWPDPGLHRVPYAVIKPAVDGNPGDPAWANAWTWNEVYPFNKAEQGGPATTFKLLWDERYLYVAFDCADEDIAAKERERDDHVYFDDCVEIFIMPSMRFRTYWEVVVAPNGSVFDAIQAKKIDLWGSLADKDENMRGLKHSQNIRGTLNMSKDKDEGYTVQMAIPFDELPGYERCPPRAGDRLNFMLVRLDKTAGKLVPYSFRPLLGWGHNIWNHAIMELQPPPGN